MARLSVLCLLLIFALTGSVLCSADVNSPLENEFDDLEANLDVLGTREESDVNQANSEDESSDSDGDEIDESVREVGATGEDESSDADEEVIDESFREVGATNEDDPSDTDEDKEVDESEREVGESSNLDETERFGGFRIRRKEESLTACCDCTYWTKWLDRDDSSGTGDWENVGAFRRYNKNINLCDGMRPLAAKCRARRLRDRRYLPEFDQDNLPSTSLFRLTAGYTCTPEGGLVCENRYNLGGQCRRYDFEIKFRCPKPKCASWERWRDRDNPSGTGDWEHRSDITVRNSACSGMTPLQARCRTPGYSVFDYWTRASAPNTFLPKYECRERTGLVCRNGAKRCRDYSIQYRCYTRPTVWTGWYDRDDPSGTGDWETTSSLRKYYPYKLCDGMTPLDAECRVRGSRRTFDQWTYASVAPNKLRVGCSPDSGLVCVNRDQPRGRRCTDYEIRFRCPCK